MHFRISLYLICLVFNISTAQNFVVSEVSMPKCYNDCDGTVTFTTSSVTGPFTAILSNSASCPNSTVQTSNLNSITINSLCGCSAPYSVAIYNPSLMLVGTMVQNIVNYATGPLVVNVNTVTPATCTNCCDGNITFTVSGGNLSNPPTFSINGTYTNNVNPLYYLCVGQHTVCVEDASGCIVCKNFVMPYNGMPTGIAQAQLNKAIEFYPNPGNGNLNISLPPYDLQTIKVFDMTGKLILLNENNGLGENRINVNLTENPDGIYHFIFQFRNNDSLHKIYLKKSD